MYEVARKQVIQNDNISDVPSNLTPGLVAWLAQCGLIGALSKGGEIGMGLCSWLQ